MKLFCKHEYIPSIVPMYDYCANGHHYNVYFCHCRKCGKTKDKIVDDTFPPIIRIT